YVWQQWFMPKPKPAGLLPDGGGVALVDAGGAPVSPGVAATPPAMAAAVPAPGAGGPKPPEQLAEFDGPTRHLVFTSYGGALKSALLKGEQFKRIANGKTEQVDLVQVPPGAPLPFSTTFAGGLPALAADAPYEL